ncbi:hypothetical protein BTJ39_14365 [Izhakiella australiensis]|uniref:Uncharacterized protein n=1 Tax=Izhakiella australiensis TaxID=1926881 RepID=A0A1S8YLA5_9GAMM|nr:hypothetical protein [Izhakiella australiensis]OON39453.1 hypothetical protein BTJ39_14365 [Izhakiella australiensis]
MQEQTPDFLHRLAVSIPAAAARVDLLSAKQIVSADGCYLTLISMIYLLFHLTFLSFTAPALADPGEDAARRSYFL